MLINSMLANSNELIHFHSLSPLFMSDDMSWFCTKMSLFIPQPAHASSLVRFFLFLLLLLLSIFICVDLLSQSLLRFVIGVDICWTVKHLRWHSNAFSRAPKMVNMNNHMIIFPSSPYWVRMVHVYLYTLCTHTTLSVSIFFASSFNKYAFMHFISATWTCCRAVSYNWWCMTWKWFCGFCGFCARNHVKLEKAQQRNVQCKTIHFTMYLCAVHNAICCCVHH